MASPSTSYCQANGLGPCKAIISWKGGASRPFFCSFKKAKSDDFPKFSEKRPSRSPKMTKNPISKSLNREIRSLKQGKEKVCTDHSTPPVLVVSQCASIWKMCRLMSSGHSGGHAPPIWRTPKIVISEIFWAYDRFWWSKMGVLQNAPTTLSFAVILSTLRFRF